MSEKFLELREGCFHVKVHHAKFIDGSAIVVKNDETREQWETVLHSIPSSKAMYEALVEFSDFASNERFKKVKWKRERGHKNLSKKR